MKHSILILLSIVFINVLNAQESLMAYLNSPEIKSTEEFRNLSVPEIPYENEYQNVIASINPGKIIRALQKDIVAYKLKEKSVFDDSEAATYSVSFKRKQSKASVTYDNNAEILSSKEVYYNVNLPLELRIKILRKYPNYNIESSKAKYVYDKDDGLNILYKIWIKDKKRKVPLVFNANFEII
ncbi:hypothetical protein [Hyunsoonleella rubra]|uniref:Uncharacterized protein n=1 Tax=Hyunsoonleella rubra TaxID=1737062 RepID=A0ABW5TC20_9FLAO